MSHGHIDRSELLRDENVRLAPGSGRGLAVGLLAVGLAAIAATAFAGITGDKRAASQAMLAYHIGFMASVGLMLGSLMFVMASHQVAAGWSASIRRVFEQIGSLAPVCFALALPVLILCVVKPGLLFKWMNPEYTAGDIIFEKKAAYLNTTFFMVRAAVYFVVWTLLGRYMLRQSLAQDQDGDRWRTRSMRKVAAPGLLLFALTTAFAAFDWTMSLDYHFFSTMWGVYFFAQGILATLALGTLILLFLTGRGKLQGCVTGEHFHDLGKLLFGFTVFWAYIAFSQYFLIWYANIPEETAYLKVRRVEGWLTLSTALSVGKFIVPFLLLLPRPNRRSRAVLGLMCLWILAMTMVDFFWVIRPQMAKQESILFSWIDVAGAVGPLAVFLGALVWRLASKPLIALGDPRLDEAIAHKNYI